MEPESRLPLPSSAVPPHSRRSILAAGLGAIAGSVATALGRPGQAQAAAGDPLVIGQTNYGGAAATRLNTTSSGGAFWLTQYGTGSGVRGDSPGGHGGIFTTEHAGRHGIWGQNNAASTGVGVAVRGDGHQNSGIAGFTNSASWYGVSGVNWSTTGTAISGQASSVGGTGVVGLGATGVSGSASAAGHAGVFGTNGLGSGINFGVWGTIGSETNGAAGVYGSDDGGAGTTNGVLGKTSSTLGNGVYGESTASAATSYGVWGSASGTGKGVVGSSAGGDGVRGASSTGYAGNFQGNAIVTGNLTVGGTINGAAPVVQLDHPLDPANRILQHQAVVSPDLKTVYDGVVTADAAGEATVVLPAWFEALNRDFRYGLTPIGGAMPDLHVKREVARGRFSIAGAKAGQRVSWQVTGIRADRWAAAHQLQVELDKTGDHRGQYLHPVEHGQPASKGVNWEPAATKPIPAPAALPPRLAAPRLLTKDPTHD